MKREAKTYKHNGKTYYPNSRAVFHVPNDEEGKAFLKQLKKYYNPEFFNLCVKNRGPHPQSYDTATEDAHSFAVYAHERQNPVTVKRVWSWIMKGRDPKRRPSDWEIDRYWGWTVSSFRRQSLIGEFSEWSVGMPTAEEIMIVRNVTVRSFLIKEYGVDRFLNELGKVIDQVGEYQLVRVDVGAKTTERWARENYIVALKMVCPSTGTVYVSPVPPDVELVPQALDWMYQTTDYLGRLQKEA